MLYIRFHCSNCGQKIEATESMAGVKIDCPACHVPMDIPIPRLPNESVRHKVIKIHKHEVAPAIPVGASQSPPGSKDTDTVSLMPVTHPPPPSKSAELFIAWACLGVGVVLALLSPTAFFFYGAMFLAAFILSIILLFDRKTAQGVIVLVWAISLPFLAMPSSCRDKISSYFDASQYQKKASRPMAKKMVFDEKTHQMVFVDVPLEKSDSEATVAVSPAPAPAVSEKPKIMRLPPMNIATVSMPKVVVLAGGAPMRTTSVSRLRSMEEMIAAEEANVKPALVPEDWMAGGFDSVSEASSGFNWQQQSEDDYASTPAVGPRSRTPEMPFVVYDDCKSGHRPYEPSANMGNNDSMKIEECSTENPYAGQTCIKAVYSSSFFWAGVAWQDPANNWGAIDGGYDLSKATKLTVWARTDAESADVEFKVGLDSSEKFKDTCQASSGKLKITPKWKQYTISLKGKDLSRVICGFAFTVEASSKPVTLFLDEIKFE